MTVVDDTLYTATLQKTIDTLKEIPSFITPQKHSQQEAVTLISLIPTFAFTQLITYITLGEYLRTHHHLHVKYLVDDNHLHHCDMVNMQDRLDKELLCFRCSSASKLLCDLAPHHIIALSSCTKESTIVNHAPLRQYIQLSKERYCGGLEHPSYEDSSRNNLLTMHKAAYFLHHNYTIESFITLRHNSVYSLATMQNYFLKKGIHCINIDQGAFKPNALSIFGKSGDTKLQNDLYQQLQLSQAEQEKIRHYLQKRTQPKQLHHNEHELLEQLQQHRKNGKKIVAFFPNVLEDAAMDEYHSLFESPFDWLLQSIEFALKHHCVVLIKPHPDEKKWRVQKGVCKQLQEHFTHPDIIYLPHNFSSAYNLIEHIDLAMLYTGTLFLEFAFLGVPTLAAGNTYIIQKSFCKDLTKERYFSLMLESNTLQDIVSQEYFNILKIAYIEFFCRDIPLTLYAKHYPYRDVASVTQTLHTSHKEMAFEAIFELITTKTLQLDRYKSYMEQR